MISVELFICTHEKVQYKDDGKYKQITSTSHYTSLHRQWSLHIRYSPKKPPNNIETSSLFFFSSLHTLTAFPAKKRKARRRVRALLYLSTQYSIVGQHSSNSRRRYRPPAIAAPDIITMLSRSRSSPIEITAPPSAFAETTVNEL